MMKRNLKDSSKKWGLVFKIENPRNKRKIEKYAKQHCIALQKGKDVISGMAYYCVLKLPGLTVEQKRKQFTDFIGEMVKKCNGLSLSIEYDKKNRPLFILEELES